MGSNAEAGVFLCVKLSYSEGLKILKDELGNTEYDLIGLPDNPKFLTNNHIRDILEIGYFSENLNSFSFYAAKVDGKIQFYSGFFIMKNSIPTYCDSDDTNVKSFELEKVLELSKRVLEFYPNRKIELVSTIKIS